MELGQWPKLGPQERVSYFRDGPTGTVSVMEFLEQNSTVVARSLTIDGKPDGNTLSDYSTMLLLGALPYLYSPEADHLRAAVVGLGTGITAGILGRGKTPFRVALTAILTS